MKLAPAWYFDEVGYLLGDEIKLIAYWYFN